MYPDDPGARVVETWDALGMRATGSHDFVLEGCRLPAERLLTRRGLREPDPKAGSGDGLVRARVGGDGDWRGGRRAGVCRRLREGANTEQRAHDRGVRGACGERIARIDLLLQRSRAEVAGHAARAWEARDAIPAAGEMGALERIAVAKVDTLNSCIEAVDLAMRVVGGVSLRKSRPMERYYRDVRAPLHNPPLEDRALEWLAKAALGS